MDAAYVCQDEAIALWPDEIVGWKVGWIAEDQQRVYGEERVVGPIFRNSVRIIRPDEEIEFPVYRGGFAAVEAEYVFRMSADAPADQLSWTDAEAADMVGALYIGIEPASSPLATINELGPAVVVSDFGNNAGLLLGPEVADWRQRIADGMTCETFIEGRSVGKGGTARLPKGPIGALAFALMRCARRGRPLRAGCLVSTGAASGIHDILPGQSSALVFDGVGTLRCRAVPAAPAGSVVG
jgi:2-keto-4-pentenoate hydratase